MPLENIGLMNKPVRLFAQNGNGGRPNTIEIIFLKRKADFDKEYFGTTVTISDYVEQLIENTTVELTYPGIPSPLTLDNDDVSANNNLNPDYNYFIRNIRGAEHYVIVIYYYSNNNTLKANKILQVQVQIGVTTIMADGNDYLVTDPNTKLSDFKDWN